MSEKWWAVAGGVVNINPEIKEKAQQILREREYVDLCINAGICPACGEGIEFNRRERFGIDLYVDVICKSEACDWRVRR